MNPNPTNPTHVYRASAGFTLFGNTDAAIILFLAITALGTAVIFQQSQSKKDWDVVSIRKYSRHQREVVVRFITPDGNAVVDMQDGSHSLTDSVWLSYRILQYNAVKKQYGWKTYGHKVPIKLSGEIGMGQKAGLYYVFASHKLHSGEWHEEVESVEVRPLAKKPEVPLIKLR